MTKALNFVEDVGALLNESDAQYAQSFKRRVLLTDVSNPSPQD